MSAAWTVTTAHGSLARWRACNLVEAIFMFGGQLVQTKVSPNLPATPTTGPTSRVEMSTLEQSGTRIDTTGSGRRVRYSPDRVVIENLDGELLSERRMPREAFAGHDLTSPWDPLPLGYFAGYTQWIYLSEERPRATCLRRGSPAMLPAQSGGSTNRATWATEPLLSQIR